jgi:hypothetical protein
MSTELLKIGTLRNLLRFINRLWRCCPFRLTEFLSGFNTLAALSYSLGRNTTKRINIISVITAIIHQNKGKEPNLISARINDIVAKP